MKLTSAFDRRVFLKSSAAVATTSLLPQIHSQGPSGSIDRSALVKRHNVTLRQPDALGVLAVGNGNFAFNADVTGLHTFPEFYEKSMPLGILSNWGWHSFPNPEDFTLDKFKFTCYDKRVGQICYPWVNLPGQGNETGVAPDAEYLRSNPHKFGVGRIGLEIAKSDGSRVTLSDVHNIEQNLDIWSGLLSSHFEVDGQPVHVETMVHPRKDEVVARIESPLIASGRLKVRIAFAYAPGTWGVEYEDWTKPDRHQTTLTKRGATAAEFKRQLDEMHYSVQAQWTPGATLTETGPHAYLLSSEGRGSPIELSAWFSPQVMDGTVDSFTAVKTACAEHWANFWTKGGAIDLSETDDSRALELERRIVLSQYVTAVHSSGNMPPQESGLTCNTWFGKFHMEMYWWHCAHFALWNRTELLENSMKELSFMLPIAKETARKQGYSGARWQKMIGSNGIESPSQIASMLIWQQPHPVHMAELIYRAKPTRATLELYRDIVMESATFIAAFMDWDPQRKQYVLGPGIASADERHRDLAHNINPTMELGYWSWALEAAQTWRERLSVGRDKQWDHVLSLWSPLPVRNGTYPILEAPVDGLVSNMATWLDGILPPKGVDTAVMRETLHQAAKATIQRSQGFVMWGNAMVAMCAARLNEPDLALDLLIGKYERNPFMVSGYARGYADIPVYLPANGGWLSAAAMMAAGWDGSHSNRSPGFPKNWSVRWEGLNRMT